MRSALLLLIAACSQSDDVPAPAIASIVPERGTPGTVVTIAGDAFCQAPASDPDNPVDCAHVGSVLFGAVPGPVGIYMDQMVTVEVPQLPAGTIDVAISVAGRRSNAVSFVVE